jgi:predicted nucleic acid-binding protein
LNKTIIFDTDIVSTFAKVEKIKVLKQLFHKNSVFITPKIHEELTTPLNFGYKFPLDIFKNFEVVYPSKKE